MTMPYPDWAAEPGLSQVICHCTGEEFVFLVSDVAARLVCTRCQAVNGVFSRIQGEPLVTFDDVPPMPPGLPGQLPHTLPPDEIMAPRDTLPPSGATWGDPPPGIPPEPLGQPPDIVDISSMGDAPQDATGLLAGKYNVPGGLPEMSPEVCNAVLKGGILDGRLTYVPPDVATYIIAGSGTWLRTAETTPPEPTAPQGRRVYLFKG